MNGKPDPIAPPGRPARFEEIHNAAPGELQNHARILNKELSKGTSQAARAIVIVVLLSFVGSCVALSLWILLRWGGSLAGIAQALDYTKSVQISETAQYGVLGATATVVIAATVSLTEATRRTVRLQEDLYGRVFEKRIDTNLYQRASASQNVTTIELLVNIAFLSVVAVIVAFFFVNKNATAPVVGLAIMMYVFVTAEAARLQVFFWDVRTLSTFRRVAGTRFGELVANEGCRISFTEVLSAVSAGVSAAGLTGWVGVALAVLDWNALLFAAIVVGVNGAALLVLYAIFSPLVSLPWLEEGKAIWFASIVGVAGFGIGGFSCARVSVRELLTVADSNWAAGAGIVSLVSLWIAGFSSLLGRSRIPLLRTSYLGKKLRCYNSKRANPDNVLGRIYNELVPVQWNHDPVSKPQLRRSYVRAGVPVLLMTTTLFAVYAAGSTFIGGGFSAYVTDVLVAVTQVSATLLSARLETFSRFRATASLWAVSLVWGAIAVFFGSAETIWVSVGLLVAGVLLCLSCIWIPRASRMVCAPALELWSIVNLQNWVSIENAERNELRILNSEAGRPD